MSLIQLSRSRQRLLIDN